MSGLMVCTACNRKVRKDSMHSNHCTNCRELSPKLGSSSEVRRFYHQLMLHIGYCQVCEEAAAVTLWNSAKNQKYSADGINKNGWMDIMLSMYDFTAVCYQCVRLANRMRSEKAPRKTRKDNKEAVWVNLCDFGTIGEVLLNGPHADHYLELIRVAEVMHEAETKVKPTTPTTAQPGSAEKIEVLRMRAERGESLWHADDEKVSAKSSREAEEEPDFRQSLVEVDTIERIRRGSFQKQRQARRAGAGQAVATAVWRGLPSRPAVLGH